MGSVRRLGLCAVALAAVSASSSCATSKIVGQNFQRVANGQSMDTSGLNQALDAFASDRTEALSTINASGGTAAAAPAAE